MSKLEEAKEILSSLKVPAKQQNGMCCCVLLGSETDALKEQLDKSIDLLELTDWQKQKMHEISIDTIGDLISAPEEKLKQAKYIADVRARTIKNAGIAAVCEYLLG